MAVVVCMYQFVDVLDAAAKPDATLQNLLEVSTNRISARVLPIFFC